MTANEFRHIVLKICNQTPTRYWLHWNHPVESPWIMAVSFESDPDRDGKFWDELKALGLAFFSFGGNHVMFHAARDFEAAEVQS